MQTIEATALTSENFARFGEVIAQSDATADFLINQNRCGRYHDLAQTEFSGGKAGISLFDSQGIASPYRFDLVERHPLGSQAFVPLDGVPYVVFVAEDQNGVPVNFQAFIASGSQAINLRRNVWHGVLTPMDQPGRYVVFDRIGEGNNLEEHWFEQPLYVTAPAV